ncbi:MAG: polyprenol monophosphomannose synthase [Candidatus Babeliales bacterium]
MQNNILVVIPTYNERENVPLLYDRIKKAYSAVDILFIDDNSPDGTGNVIDTLTIQDPTVHAIHRAGKLGLGTAYFAAFDYLKTHHYDSIIIMDADLTHDPKYIPAMIAKKDSADIVIGSRYAQGASMHGWGSIRLFFTHFWRGMIKYGLGLNCDATGAFRVYNTAILKPHIYNNIHAKGFAFQMESLYRFKQCGATIAQVPIEAHQRIHGVSKLSGKVMREVAITYFVLLFDRILCVLHIRSKKKNYN